MEIKINECASLHAFVDTEGQLALNMVIQAQEYTYPVSMTRQTWLATADAFGHMWTAMTALDELQK